MGWVSARILPAPRPPTHARVRDASCDRSNPRDTVDEITYPIPNQGNDTMTASQTRNRCACGRASDLARGTRRATPRLAQRKTPATMCLRKGATARLPAAHRGMQSAPWQPPAERARRSLRTSRIRTAQHFTGCRRARAPPSMRPPPSRTGSAAPRPCLHRAGTRSPDCRWACRPPRRAARYAWQEPRSACQDHP